MAAITENLGGYTPLESPRAPVAADPKRLWARVDRLLAPQAGQLRSDEMRRARLAVAVCAAIGVICTASSINLLVHGVFENLTVTIGMLAAMACIPLVLRKTGSVVFAGNAMAGSMAVALAALILNSGAVTVPPFILLPVVPLTAAIIAGARSATVWSGVSFALLAGFYILAREGMEPAIELDPHHVFQGRFFGSASMVAFVLLFSRAYEQLRARTSDELKAAHHLVNVRNRELSDERARQLELKDRFLSHVSHELRTPLTALHQFLSILLDGLAGEIRGEQREYLEIAFRNAEQLRRMIDDLMDLNRARNGKMRVESDVFELGPVFVDTLRNLESRALEREVRLEAVGCDASPVVQADSARVRQVLGNLIENAIKFTPAGGYVEVKAVEDADEEGFARISVRDTGCGIESEAVDKIFDRLHQEQSAEIESRLGLGLGLAIAKELVQRQGGRIWAESELGVGSTFHFTLPVFSLRRSLGRCVVDGSELRPDFSVVHVEHSVGRAADSERLERGVLHLLRSTVFYPEKDVVLPPGAAGSDPGRLTVLAATGAEGVAALATRLRLRLERFAQEQGNIDAKFSVLVHTEEIPVGWTGGSRDELFEKLAHRVEELLCADRNQNQGGET